MVFDPTLYNPTLYQTLIPLILLILIPLIIWDAIWKGVGMWKAGRNNQLGWFVCILIFNTLGILPIIYILFFQKDQNSQPNRKKAKRKR
ncbi:MAG: DUF5652 family protein [Nanoarchaeota archaeon]